MVMDELLEILAIDFSSVAGGEARKNQSCKEFVCFFGLKEKQSWRRPSFLQIILWVLIAMRPWELCVLFVPLKKTIIADIFWQLATYLKSIRMPGTWLDLGARWSKMCPARNNSIVRCVRLLHQPKTRRRLMETVWVKRWWCWSKSKQQPSFCAEEILQGFIWSLILIFRRRCTVFNCAGFLP